MTAATRPIGGLSQTQRHACGVVADLIARLPIVLAAEIHARGSSQQRVADETGLSRQSVHRWVNGRALPRSGELVLLLAWLAGPAAATSRTVAVPSVSAGTTTYVWPGGATWAP